MAPALRVHEFGPDDGAPMVALHGVGGHGGRWRRLADKQLPQFRVLAPDLRGHGESERRPPWTLERHAADVLEVIEKAGVTGATVVGHSFGGVVAIYLARLAPRLVGRLVLLDPAVGVDPTEALELAEAADVRHPSLADAETAQRNDWPTAVDDVISEELAANWVEVDGGWRPRYSPAAIATAWSEMCRTALLPPAGTPTLVVRAMRDDYVPAGFVEECRSSLGAEFSFAELDCGHMVYLEQPDDVGDLITEFVGRG